MSETHLFHKVPSVFQTGGASFAQLEVTEKVNAHTAATNNANIWCRFYIFKHASSIGHRANNQRVARRFPFRLHHVESLVPSPAQPNRLRAGEVSQQWEKLLSITQNSVDCSSQRAYKRARRPANGVLRATWLACFARSSLANKHEPYLSAETFGALVRLAAGRSEKTDIY